MDEAVKTLILTTFAGLALAHLPAGAQTLNDPTRPPAALNMSRAGGGEPNGNPRLQSVLISPRAGGRHVAVIDGETVRLGQSFRGARVARMSQTEVELVRGTERQVLRLEGIPEPVPGMSAARPPAAAVAGLAQTPR
jgi:MSHA biogenesis protein MshK